MVDGLGRWPAPQEEQAKASTLDTLFFKVYPREALSCSAVGGSKDVIDPKTLRKWVWLFIERIAELADDVVKFCVVPMLTSLHTVASPPGSCRACCRHPTDRL